MSQLGKSIAISILVVVVLVATFVAGMFFQAQLKVPLFSASAAAALPLDVAGGRQPFHSLDGPADFATFWEAWSFLDEHFYGEIPADEERLYGSIRGMVETFGDQHTAFVDPIHAAVHSENISGSFEGIGASIRLDEAGRLLVADPYPDRPAFAAGLRPDDLILEIDGQSVEGLSLYEAVLLIRGPAGSTVVLKIRRDDSPTPFEVAIVRAKIEIEVVQARLLAGDIAYLRLTQFSKGAADKLSEALTDLSAQGARRIIFDLRSNPGGLLSEAVNVSSIFIEEGLIVVERLKGGEEKLFEVKRGYQTALEIPLVVLVNGGSASASEIVAGAIQDYERGQIVGEQTFGKGSVQLPHTLADESQLRVTVAEWLTPNRRQIHGEGITPDLVVEMSSDDYAQGRDPQLDAAVKLLRDLPAGESGTGQDE
jgi:carboxyl-terminal processing protease